MGMTAVRGVPGEVGGRARGAELMLWDARLWVCDWDPEEGHGVCTGRVFVIVIDTENVSPAKYADCVGVTTTRIPVSASAREGFPGALGTDIYPLCTVDRHPQVVQ